MNAQVLRSLLVQEHTVRQTRVEATYALFPLGARVAFTKAGHLITGTVESHRFGGDLRVRSDQGGLHNVSIGYFSEIPKLLSSAPSATSVLKKSVVRKGGRRES